MKPTTIDVFYYTGPYTDTLLPGADALIGRLSPARRERLLKHAEPQRRIELAALRILELGMGVRGHSTFALADVEFVQVAGVTKKPYWTKGSVNFSISHTDAMAMVAIASIGAVGIDVEHRRPVDPRVVRRLLNEQAASAAELTEDNALSRWTEIEAVLKAAGAGVMHGKEIDWRPDSVTMRNRRWFVHPVKCGDGHIAHVASDVASAKVNAVPIEFL